MECPSCHGHMRDSDVKDILILRVTPQGPEGHVRCMHCHTLFKVRQVVSLVPLEFHRRESDKEES